MSRRIVVAGYYGYGNAGDEAILSCMVRDLKRVTNAEIVVVSGDPRRTEAEHGVEAVARSSLDAILREVEASDLAIVGGGSHFHDHYHFGRDTILSPRHGALPFCLSVLAAAGMYGRRAMLYAVGVGPLRSQESRRLTAAALELCQRATVRDEASLRTLQSLGLPAAAMPPVEVVADPAFRLAPSPKDRVDGLLEDLGLDRWQPLLGVSLRYWDLDGDEAAWEEQAALALDLYLGARPEWRAVLLPLQREHGHTYEDDSAVLSRVRGRMRQWDRTVVVQATFEPSLMAGLIGSCQLVLAMRYHAVLFALASGVPVVNLAYDPKTRALMETYGAGDLCLDPVQWTAQKIDDVLCRSRPPGADQAGISRRLVDLATRSVEVASGLLCEPEPPPSVTAGIVREIIEERLHSAVDLDLRLDLATARMRRLVRERDELRRTAVSYETSAAVRLVTRYWRAIETVLPPGTARRRAYDRMCGRESAGSVRGAVVDSPADRRSGSPREDPPDDIAAFCEDLERAGARELVIVFSGMRLDENEGQRPTQLALELARRRIAVIFDYWVWDAELPPPRRRIDEMILEVPHGRLDGRWETVADVLPGATRIALFEWPHPELFEALFRLRAGGWRLAYDLIDDWRAFAEVGQAAWYDEAVEARFAAASDAVFAVNPALARRARQLGARDVTVVPNGVRLDIAEVSEPRPLQRGAVTVGYFGQLTDAWFDWDMVLDAARRRTAWRFYLIGYGAEIDPTTLPSNVVLLGRLPQRELAAFAANWDVAVIPFRPGPIAESADPVKVYEYLAMGLPVVTSGVPAPEGTEEFVRRCDGLPRFLAGVERAVSHPASEAAARVAFSASCSWQRRVTAILREVLSSASGRVQQGPPGSNGECI